MSFLHHMRRRHFSTSILAPDSTTPLTSYQKSRAALSLLKSESNPEKILDICHAASLTPDSHLDRVAFYKLSDSKCYTGIRPYISDLKSRPDLRNERFTAHAIVLYGQAGLLPDAIETFKELDRLGIPCTVKSLNALLFACLVSKEYGSVRHSHLCQQPCGFHGLALSLLEQMLTVDDGTKKSERSERKRR